MIAGRKFGRCLNLPSDFGSINWKREAKRSIIPKIVLLSKMYLKIRRLRRGSPFSLAKSARAAVIAWSIRVFAGQFCTQVLHNRQLSMILKNLGVSSCLPLNTESINSWSCAAQWLYSQSIVSKVLRAM